MLKKGRGFLAGSRRSPKLVDSRDEILVSPSCNVPRDMDVTQLVSDMLVVLQDSETGLAVAAPQIGEPFRVIVVRIRSTSLRPELRSRPPRIFINPEIELLGEEDDMDEGCISFLGLRSVIKRHSKVRVSYETQARNKRTCVLEGIMAQVMQHEVDHLDGILYFMHIKNADDLKVER